MEECGVLLQIFPEETAPTASWLLTVTLTPHTFRNHVGKCRMSTVFCILSSFKFDISEMKSKKICIFNSFS